MYNGADLIKYYQPVNGCAIIDYSKEGIDVVDSALPWKQGSISNAVERIGREYITIVTFGHRLYIDMR